jgi:two-component system, NtrC family, sensor kinase
VANLPWSEMRSEIPEIIDEIAAGAERIRAIVSELRAFGRDQDPGTRKPEAINDVVRGSLRLLSNHIRKATTSFAVDLAADLPLVSANAGRLEQVIINLVLNSCQAIQRRDAGIRVVTSLDRRNDRVEVRVIDEGCGIASDDLKNIRDPFFTTKRSEGGMGLGLAVSDRIVQEHNGTLTFESNPGRGTTAVLSIPALRETAEK